MCPTYPDGPRGSPVPAGTVPEDRPLPLPVDPMEREHRRGHAAAGSARSTPSRMGRRRAAKVLLRCGIRFCVPNGGDHPVGVRPVDDDALDRALGRHLSAAGRTCSPCRFFSNLMCNGHEGFWKNPLSCTSGWASKHRGRTCCDSRLAVGSKPANPPVFTEGNSIV